MARSQEDLPPNRHRILHLQATAGNRAVSRMVQTGNATRTIQRFAFDAPDWTSATEVTRSSDGASGVAFFKDGTDAPLVVKAGRDPVRETQLATLFYNKMGRKQKFSAPPTRLASDIERVRIANVMQSKGAWNEDEKAQDIENFGYKAPNVWIMGMARGKAFGSKRKGGSFQESPLGGGNTAALLEDPDYIRRMGFVTYCDLFLGNGDRIDAGNLGNWMTDTSGAIALIDNFAGSVQRLTRSDQESWENAFMNDLRPSGFVRKGEAVYQILRNMVAPEVKQALERSLTMNPAARQQFFGKHFAKGMEEAKKVVLAKLAPAFGKRSRSLKNVVVEGEGGQEAWNVLKRRVQLVKNLK